VEFWCAGESSSEDEAAYDEDDENAENNWRNDYPDDDPMYFERLNLEDIYSSDDGEYWHPAVWLQTAGSKVCSFGQWAAATCAAPLQSLPVSTPLRIVNRCWPGFPCKWRYINVETFNLYCLLLTCASSRSRMKILTSSLTPDTTRLTHQYLLSREEPPQCPSCNSALTVLHSLLELSNITVLDRNTFLLLLSKSCLIQSVLVTFFLF